MANIELVIKIPQETYDFLKRYGTDGGIIEKAVLNGTRLPKGHGNLKDANDIVADIYDRYMSSDFKVYNESVKKCMDMIRSAPTIIEADKGEVEE